MTTLVLIATTEANAKRILETARKDDSAVSATIDVARLDYPESARGAGADLGGRIYLQRQGIIDEPAA